MSLSFKPNTLDYLRPNGFRFIIQDMPNLVYTCQSVSLPGLSLGFGEQQTPFVNLPIVGDKLQFEELSMRFIVSEGLQNYAEIYRWMIGLGFPDNHEQYESFIQNSKATSKFGSTNSLERRNGSLVILNSANNPKLSIDFVGMFPINLTGVEFDVSTTTVDYIQASVTFKYQSFTVKTL